jgi:hypothetical protein
VQARQLPGIGRQLAQRLRAAGVGTLRQLAELDPRRIETITQRNYPFGAHVAFSGSIHITFCDVDAIGITRMHGSDHAGNQVRKELQSKLPADIALELMPTSTPACTVDASGPWRLLRI